MKRIIKWFATSHRWQHLAGGVAIGAAGAAADGFFAGVYAGVAAGAAMEFKDYQWGGKPDAVDAALTCAGAVIGAGLVTLCKR